MSSARFNLRLDPDWAVIGPARELVAALVAAKLGDHELAQQVSVAAHELLENAIRYTGDAASPVHLRLTIDERVFLSVENPIRSQDVPRLLAEVSAADGAADPLAFYRSKMVESVSRPDGRSGLGLARIRFESQMSLSCAVTGGVASVSCCMT